MGRFLIGFLLTFGLVTSVTSPVLALDFFMRKSNDGVLYASGDFEVGDSAKLKKYLRKARQKPHTAWLESPGGVSVEGLLVGKTFRNYGLATHIPAKSDCASACVLAFIGGVIRSKHPAGRLGVHNGSMAFSDEYIDELKEVLLDDDMNIDDKLRIITILAETATARSMALKANYVQIMGVSMQVLFPSTETLHTDIDWLSDKELRQYNVINLVN